MAHTLTGAQATDIHNDAAATGYPSDALRINYYRIGGGGMSTLLNVPGNDHAPCYQRRMTGEWELVSGDCTADEWNAQREQADLYAMQDEYRDEAETLASLRQF